MRKVWLLSLLVWVIAGNRPRLRVSAAHLRDLLPFGLNLFGFRVINCRARKPRSGAYARPFLISSIRATEMSEVRLLPIVFAMSATAAGPSPPRSASARRTSRWAGVALSHRER